MLGYSRIASTGSDAATHQTRTHTLTAAPENDHQRSANLLPEEVLVPSDHSQPQSPRLLCIPPQGTVVL